jgi:hypothetical protein
MSHPHGILRICMSHSLKLQEMIFLNDSFYKIPPVSLFSPFGRGGPRTGMVFWRHSPRACKPKHGERAHVSIRNKPMKILNPPLINCFI